MLLFALGDCLPDFGTYSLHSKFNHLTNFSFGDLVITVTSKKQSLAPLTILVDSDVLCNEEEIVITAENIIIGKHTFDRRATEVYNSKLNLDHNKKTDASTLKKFTNELLPYLEHFFANDSLSFLLYRKSPSNSDTFANSLEARFRRGSNFICLGNFEEAITTLRGLGFGLTPAGDDFLCGMFAALHLQRYFNPELKLDFNEFYSIAKSENKISNTSLFLFCQNCYPESFYNFVNLFISCNRNDTVGSAINLMNVGHTSGSDILAGFLFTMLNIELPA